MVSGATTLSFTVLSIFILVVQGNLVQSYQCCSLTEEELRALGEKAETSPKSWSDEVYTRESCASCPKGKCSWVQVSGRQYCLSPRVFIAAHNESTENSACTAGYGSIWPASSGQVDFRIFACTGPVDVKRAENCPTDNKKCNILSRPNSSPGGSETTGLSPEERAALIGGVFTIIAAIIGGIIGCRYYKNQFKS